MPQENRQYCPICKKETRHTISFIGSPGGWRCAEHGTAALCHKCGKKLPAEIRRINKALGATSNCRDCSGKGVP